MNGLDTALRVFLFIGFVILMIGLGVGMGDAETPVAQIKRLKVKEKLMLGYIDNHCPSYYKPWEVLEK